MPAVSDRRHIVGARSAAAAVASDLERQRRLAPRALSAGSARRTLLRPLPHGRRRERFRADRAAASRLRRLDRGRLRARHLGARLHPVSRRRAGESGAAAARAGSVERLPPDAREHPRDRGSRARSRPASQPAGLPGAARCVCREPPPPASASAALQSATARSARAHDLQLCSRLALQRTAAHTLRVPRDAAGADRPALPMGRSRGRQAHSGSPAALREHAANAVLARPDVGPPLSRRGGRRRLRVRARAHRARAAAPHVDSWRHGRAPAARLCTTRGPHRVAPTCPREAHRAKAERRSREGGRQRPAAATSTCWIASPATPARSS